MIGEKQVGAPAQVALMAAVQPWLTGGIAHTVTLPQATTTEEMRQLIHHGWQAGLKSLSLYREGCALYEDSAALAEEAGEQAPLIFREARSSLSVQVPQVAAALAKRFLEARRELPLRRNGFTQKATIGGHALYLRTGEYEDGSLGEIFLDMPGEAEAYRALVQQFARAISLALQHGVPLAAFAEAFAHGEFAPAGPVEGSEIIAEASSVLDYVFRELQAAYARQEEVPGEATVIPLRTGTQ
jgi:ribonucleoside-diphosphate reductase alpha chain